MTTIFCHLITDGTYFVTLSYFFVNFKRQKKDVVFFLSQSLSTANFVEYLDKFHFILFFTQSQYFQIFSCFFIIILQRPKWARGDNRVSPAQIAKKKKNWKDKHRKRGTFKRWMSHHHRKRVQCKVFRFVHQFSFNLVFTTISNRRIKQHSLFRFRVEKEEH